MKIIPFLNPGSTAGSTAAGMSDSTFASLFGWAEGGLISGPGTGTSDSIPIRASAGEYVVPAHLVAAPGMYAALEGLRTGRISTSGIRSTAVNLRGMPGYAGGGLVTPMGGGSTSVNGQITVGLDEGLVLKALESPEGQRVMLRVAGKNRRAFGRALGG